MKSLTNSKNIKIFLFDKAVVICLILLVIVVSILKDGFLSQQNITVILLDISAYGVVSLSMTFAIICGEFDLSPSSVFAFSSILFVSLANTWGFVGALAVTLLCGVLIGVVNGLLVSKAKINAFVVTLGMMIFVKGFALNYNNGTPVMTSNKLVSAIGTGTLFGISYLTYVFAVLLLISAFILKKTRFGRNLYATGGNVNVARLAGVNTVFYKFIIFVIIGFACALGGIMLACTVSSGSVQYGTDLSMVAVAVVVIGGTSLSGGNGGVWRTLLGMLLIGVLINALTWFGVQPYVQQVVEGLVLITVVVMDALVNRSGIVKV
jgi:ribose transport system permease protein